ncbi:ClpP/crotonase-like domain-containing protein [Usnea florida]
MYDEVSERESVCVCVYVCVCMGTQINYNSFSPTPLSTSRHLVLSSPPTHAAVIIVLHGLSYGIAIDIASCADIRLCTSGTTFSVKEVDVGIAADLGTLSRLPKIVGNASWVKDVCMSARPFSADEALTVGFVSRVVEDRTEDALRMAEVLADKSPVAVQGTKEVLNYARDHGVGDSLRQTGTWNAASIQTRDVVEAVEAWRKKRSARFEKL